MAINLTFEYGKRLGLPGYSSHTFGVTAKAEVTELNQISSEAARMYQILQQSVDSQIVSAGFVPSDDANDQSQVSSQPQNADNLTRFPGNSPHNQSGGVLDSATWKCSSKQTDLILKIMEENQLPAGWADKVAQELHGKPMSGLTKLEASGVVSEFISRFRRNKSRDGNQPQGGRQ